MNLSEAAQILGISEDATPDEAKSAFRKLAVKLHPDVNKSENAEEEFKKANEACRVFENPPQEQSFNDMPEDLSDLFTSAFGFRVQQQSIYNFNETITFEQSVLGAQVKLTYTVTEYCDRCKGSGNDYEPSEDNCSLCLGEGKRSVFNKKIACNECRGTGKALRKKSCHKCNGKRHFRTTKTQNVAIPPGVFTGQSMTVRNGSDIIIIAIRVIPHAEFRLIEKDIHSNISVSFLDSLKGLTKEVNTIYGKKNLKIRGGRRHGDKISAAGLGVKPDGGHIFTLEVELPEDIDSLVEFLESKDKKEENGL